MNKYFVFIFLIFAIILFFLHRYELAFANLLTFLGFALYEFRFNIVVLLRLEHIWEYRFRKIGNFVGYLALTAILVMIALRYLKIHNF